MEAMATQDNAHASEAHPPAAAHGHAKSVLPPPPPHPVWGAAGHVGLRAAKLLLFLLQRELDRLQVCPPIKALH